MRLSFLTSTIRFRYTWSTGSSARNAGDTVYEVLISTRFSLGVEKEQADAGRDDLTGLARPNSHNEQDWQPYPVDPYSSTV